MLGFFRSAGSRYFLWIIVGLLILALAGFGLGGAVSGIAGSSLARVDDRKISPSQFGRAYQQQMQQLRQQLGQPTLTANQARSFGFDQQVLGQLITTEILNTAAADLGISAGDVAVRDALVTDPNFIGPDRTFNADSYRFVLDQLGMTTTEYEETLRDQIARNLLVAGIGAGARMPDTAAITLLSHALEERDLSFVVLTPDRATPAETTPDDIALQAVIDADTARYETPERREVSVAHLSPEQYLDRITVPEEDIAAEYAARADDYNTDARRIMDRIVFGTREDAAAAKARIDAGEASFLDVLQERGLSPAESDIGEIFARDLRADARDEIFGTEDTGVFGPFDSDLGPAIYRVNAVLAAVSRPLEEVRDELENLIALEEAGYLVLDAVGPIEDQLASGASVENLAASTDLELQNFTYTAGMRDGLGGDPALARAISRLEAGETSDLVDMREGGLAVVRVDEIIAPAVPALEDIRELVEIDWRQADLQRQLTEEAEAMAAELGEGKTLSAVAAAAGLNVEAAPGLTRRSQNVVVAPAIMEALFGAEEGAVEIADLPDGRVMLAQLDSITAFDPDSDAGREAVDALVEQLTGGLAVDRITDTATALRASARVTINQTLLDQLFQQMP